MKSDISSLAKRMTWGIKEAKKAGLNMDQAAMLGTFLAIKLNRPVVKRPRKEKTA